MNLIQQLLTGKDGITHDMGRWSWVISMVAVIALAGYHEWKGVVVAITYFATAISAVVAAHGAALWAKKDTEPGSDK